MTLIVYETPRQHIADAVARVRQVGIDARRAGGVPKGKRNGKTVRVKSQAYAEGEKARDGVRVPGDF